MGEKEYVKTITVRKFGLLGEEREECSNGKKDG
jgi:hypothetical protein